MIGQRRIVAALRRSQKIEGDPLLFRQIAATDRTFRRHEREIPAPLGPDCIQQILGEADQVQTVALAELTVRKFVRGRSAKFSLAGKTFAEVTEYLKKHILDFRQVSLAEAEQLSDMMMAGVLARLGVGRHNLEMAGSSHRAPVAVRWQRLA